MTGRLSGAGGTLTCVPHRNPGRSAVDGITADGRPCNGCQTWKPWSAFHRRANGRNGRAATCADCLSDRRPDRTEEQRAARERYAQDSEHRRQMNIRRTERQYGLEAGGWDAMVIAQAGRCGACSDPMRKPCVDHDHATGRVRQLLCYPCNVTLGLVDDSVARLRALIVYLETA